VRNVIKWIVANRAARRGVLEPISRVNHLTAPAGFPIDSLW
jgi:hypothetical protein